MTVIEYRLSSPSPFYLQTIERILMYYFKCNEFESGE